MRATNNDAEMEMEMIFKKPTIVLFDMDGTTVRHVNPVFLSILESIDNIIYRTANLIRRRKEIIDLSEDPAAPRGLLVHRALHKIRRKPVEQIVQPCPGIYLLLNLLKRNNIPMGVVSNSLGKGYGHDILKTFHLNGYYDAQIFREDIQRSKPHPDPILRALRAIKEEPSADDVVWYIGDRHKDVAATVEANKLMPCDIIPFAYGLDAAVAIMKYNIGNDHIIMNYADFFSQVKPLIESDDV